MASCFLLTKVVTFLYRLGLYLSTLVAAMETSNNDLDPTQQLSSHPDHMGSLEASKKLHGIDHQGVSDHQGVGKEANDDEHPIYFPPELVNQGPWNSKTKYFSYLIELHQNFDYDIPVHNIVLVMRSKLESDILSMDFDLEVDRGLLSVKLKYIEETCLTSQQVLSCRKFQITLFKILMDHKMDKLEELSNEVQLGNDLEIDYFLLPSIVSQQKPSIDWKSINSVHFSYENVMNKDHVNCSLKGNAHKVHTKGGPVCACMLQNSLVCAPHNNYIYCITSFFENLNANSPLKQMRRGRSVTTYKEFYEFRHKIKLRYDKELFLRGRHIFSLQNYLLRCRHAKDKESEKAYVELPPELCRIIMSPISISVVYSFTFAPSIMHRIESLLIAINLKKMQLDDCIQNVGIPTIKVLEAITTKNCQEKLHLESLETLGDSFLKYAVSQQLFKTYQNCREGPLTNKREKIISNVALCKLGCGCKLPGFIRDDMFDPQNWLIPGHHCVSHYFNEELLSHTRTIYVRGRRKLTGKIIADVVEALIGAYLSTGGERAALLFMNWIGIEVDFKNIPYERNFHVQREAFVNLCNLESQLKYKFSDPSILVEALTHGSYNPEIQINYQRLEFLGDSVLDFLITLHFHNKYPGLSPGLLTDLKSASVNNECYAWSVVRAGLHKHILHNSKALEERIVDTVKNFEEFTLDSTFGWESGKYFCEVLGDFMESLAGAILVDSGYNKEVVFESIRPLLEPLVTPQTLMLQPVRELLELCQKKHFDIKQFAVPNDCNASISITIQVKVNDAVFERTATAASKEIAKKIASKKMLQLLKTHNIY